jgi:hypothetical protein
MGEKRNVCWASVGKPERKRSLGNDARVVLKRILKKLDGSVGLVRLAQEDRWWAVMHMGNKPLGCIK